MKIFCFIFLASRIFLLPFIISGLIAPKPLEAKMTDPIKKIYLTSIGTVELDLKKLIPPIKNAYNCEVEIISGLQEVEFAYNKKRKQYYAPLLLQKLENFFSNQPTNQPTYRLVGIIDQDLYAQGLNFIFGEAKGNVTIVSLWRFKPCTKINTEAEEKVLLDRTTKTVIHEIGHTLGLGHCPNRKCVMFFSNWLGDTDHKEKTFCEKCVNKLSFYLQK